MQIPVGSEMLFANQENHVVDKLVIFKNVLSFWITVVRIRKILCTKVVCQMVVVGEFPVVGLIFVVCLASG